MAIIKVIKVIKPSFRSIFLYILGFLMGPLIVLLERSPREYNFIWYFASLFFLGLILYRLSLKYVFTNKSIIKSVLWGILPPKSLSLESIETVEVFQGLNGRIFGFAILWLASKNENEPGFLLVGIKNYENLKKELEVYNSS